MNEETISLKINNISPEIKYNEIVMTIKIPEKYDNYVKINYPYYNGTTNPKGYAFLTCKTEETAKYIIETYNGIEMNGKNWIITRDVGLMKKTENCLKELILNLQLENKEKYKIKINWKEFYFITKIKEILFHGKNKKSFLLICLSLNSSLIIEFRAFQNLYLSAF